MEFNLDGLDDAMDELDELASRAEALDGEHKLDANELLTPEFIRKHTEFSTFNDLLDASPFVVKSQEDFEAIPDTPWDEFIADNTSFARWEDMLGAAGTEWAKNQLGL